jgi:hypothetical protein
MRQQLVAIKIRAVFGLRKAYLGVFPVFDRVTRSVMAVVVAGQFRGGCGCACSVVVWKPCNNEGRCLRTQQKKRRC